MWKLKVHYRFQNKASWYWIGHDGTYACYRKTGIRYWIARIFKLKLDYIRKLHVNEVDRVTASHLLHKSNHAMEDQAWKE